MIKNFVRIWGYLFLCLAPLNTYAQEVPDPVTRPYQIEFTAAEQAWLQAHPVLRVAGPRAFPPFRYVTENGAVAGMSADYIHLLSERLGVKMDVHTELPWPEVLQKAQERTLDVISCAAKSDEREKYLTFSDPYLSFPMVIISQKDAPFIGGLDDLHGKQVAVSALFQEYVWEYQEFILTKFPSHGVFVTGEPMKDMWKICFISWYYGRIWRISTPRSTHLGRICGTSSPILPHR